MTQKWLRQTDPKVNLNWLKSDSGPHLWVTFESILSHLNTPWGGTLGVTFESLLGHFSSFCVHCRVRSIAKQHMKLQQPSRSTTFGNVPRVQPPGTSPEVSRPNSREMTSLLSGVRKRVVSKRVVSADVPPERKPERGYVRQNHPFTKPPFYLPMTLFGGFAKGWFPKGWFRRMFPRNENRNEGTFAKTTLLRNRPFISQRPFSGKADTPWGPSPDSQKLFRRTILGSSRAPCYQRELLIFC